MEEKKRNQKRSSQTERTGRQTVGVKRKTLILHGGGGGEGKAKQSAVKSEGGETWER